ncbi:MAG: AMP-binding protein [Pseudomonadota bacterium]
MSSDGVRLPEPGQPALPPDRFAWCGDAVAYWAERQPDSVALADPLYRLTYVELEAIRWAWAEALKEAGLAPGDRLLILCENCCATAVATLAAQALRAWAIPLNARLSAREVATIAEHSGARLVITTDALSPPAAAHGADLGAREQAPFFTLGAKIAQGPAPQPPEPVESDPTRQVAAMIYTTGTTGAPKGVMLSHDNLMFIAGRSSATRWLTPADHVYAVLPISHVFGLASVLQGTLYQGGRLMLAPRFDGEAVLKAFAEEGISIFQGVPQMYARLAGLIEATGGAVEAPRLRYLSSGGAPLAAELKERIEGLLGLALHNGYGLTETSPTVSTTPTEARCPDTSTGPLLPDVAVKIVTPQGKEAAPDEVGEIWVKGRLIMRGYYHDPAATAAVVTEEGWFTSGDLGRLDARGYLWVVGRLKELIIRSGFNVYPPEVEAVLTGHPDIALAAVLGAKQADGNEEVVAFLQPRPGRTPDLAAVKAYAAERLAPYKRPGRYEVLAELPAAATGKLLKHKLKDRL